VLPLARIAQWPYDAAHRTADRRRESGPGLAQTVLEAGDFETAAERACVAMLRLAKAWPGRGRLLAGTAGAAAPNRRHFVQTAGCTRPTSVGCSMPLICAKRRQRHRRPDRPRSGGPRSSSEPRSSATPRLAYVGAERAMANVIPLGARRSCRRGRTARSSAGPPDRRHAALEAGIGAGRPPDRLVHASSAAKDSPGAARPVELRRLGRRRRAGLAGRLPMDLRRLL